MSLFDTAADLVGDLAGPYALIISPVRNIGGIISDVTIEEVHSDRLEITQHPIQTGAVITDHSFAMPSQLTIRCGSSDSSAGYPGYANLQYQAFLALQASRQPFSVSTGKRLYDNMLIRDIQVTTDDRSENVLMAVVSLHQATFTDLGNSSGMTADSQRFPQQTAPEINYGFQSLVPASVPQLPFFASGNVSLPKT